MSVPTWKRNKSEAQFIYVCYELNKEIGRITTKVPKKYRNNYCDELIKEGLEALKYLQMGNDIFVGNQEQMLYERIKLFHKAIGVLDNILTLSDIFFEMMKNNNEVRNDWVDRSGETIGNLCDSVIRMTQKVAENDRLRFLSKYGKN